MMILTLPAPRISESYIKIINNHFLFSHFFVKSQKVSRHHKIFRGTTKCEFKLILSPRPTGTGRVNKPFILTA